MPGDFRCDLTTRVRSIAIIARAAIGRIGRPAFPAPSDMRAGDSKAYLGRYRAARMLSCVTPSFRGDAKHRTTMCDCTSENLEIPGLVLTGMTKDGLRR